MRAARLAAIALLVVGCTSVGPAASVTGPAASAPAPTPIIIYVTPAPTPTPQPTPKPSPTPVTHQMAVQFTLNAASYTDLGGTDTDCYGVGGYSDIETGLQAIVSDAQGTVVASMLFSTPGTKPSGLSCEFTSQIAVVPDLPLYSVEVGRRGKVVFQRSELAGNGWVAAVSLGN